MCSLRQFVLKLLSCHFWTLKWGPQCKMVTDSCVACWLESKRVSRVCPCAFHDPAFLILTGGLSPSPPCHMWSSRNIKSLHVLEAQHMFPPLANSYVTAKTLFKHHHLQEAFPYLPEEASWFAFLPPTSTWMYHHRGRYPHWAVITSLSRQWTP